MTPLSDDELCAQIEAGAAALGKLKRQWRARKAGRASAVARSTPTRDEEIKAAYHAVERRYGALKTVASAFRLTTRQVQRILRAVAPVLIIKVAVAAASEPIRKSDAVQLRKNARRASPTLPPTAGKQNAFDF